jgi:hypothetical protein
MKRAILLATVALLAMLVLVPMAMAQDTTMMMGTTMMMEQTGGQMMGGTTMMEMTSGQMAQDDLPTSGGPAILLPAAALLVGSGILTYAILRRR